MDSRIPPSAEQQRISELGDCGGRYCSTTPCQCREYLVTAEEAGAWWGSIRGGAERLDKHNLRRLVVTTLALRENFQRLWDLVRLRRHSLFEDAAISAQEFAALVQDHPAVERLETNDRLRQRAEAAERQVAEKDARIADLEAADLHSAHIYADLQAERNGLQEQVAELKREIGERDGRIKKLADGLLAWESMEASLCPEDVGFAEYIKALRAQLQEAKKDTERLSWLGYTGHGFVRGTDTSKWTIEAPREGIRLIRSAIDAARSEGGSTKGTAHSADAEGARNATDLGGDSREER